MFLDILHYLLKLFAIVQLLLDFQRELVTELRSPVSPLHHGLHLAGIHYHAVAAYHGGLCLLDVDEVHAAAAVIDQYSAITAGERIHRGSAHANVVGQPADIYIGGTLFLQLRRQGSLSQLLVVPEHRVRVDFRVRALVDLDRVVDDLQVLVELSTPGILHAMTRPQTLLQQRWSPERHCVVHLRRFLRDIAADVHLSDNDNRK